MMPDLLADVAQKLRLLNGSYLTGTYSGTTTAAGFFTFSHQAAFTPGKVFITQLGAAASADLGLPLVYAVTSTTITLSYFTLAGSVASMAVAGSYRVEA